jgi:hypothetical protein
MPAVPNLASREANFRTQVQQDVAAVHTRRCAASSRVPYGYSICYLSFPSSFAGKQKLKQNHQREFEAHFKLLVFNNLNQSSNPNKVFIYTTLVW